MRKYLLDFWRCDKPIIFNLPNHLTFVAVVVITCRGQRKENEWWMSGRKEFQKEIFSCIVIQTNKGLRKREKIFLCVYISIFWKGRKDIKLISYYEMCMHVWYTNHPAERYLFPAGMSPVFSLMLDSKEKKKKSILIFLKNLNSAT